MNFEPGDYVGFTGENYNALLDIDNETLHGWLTNNFQSVAGGQYYIYTGDDEFEMIDMMEMYGDPEYVEYFVYMKSTWSMGGTN